MVWQFPKQTIRDIDVRGRTVLVRADYNVPLTEDGQISDDFRLRASLPTLQYLLQQNCRLVLISHLGRPQGRQAAFSLRPVAQRLAELLGRPVQLVDDCVGDRVAAAVHRAELGSVILLENLRFHAAEKANDASFAAALARDTQADYLVQDGFAVTHRAAASTQAITKYLPSVAGLLVASEYTTLTQAMAQPARPLVAVIGGAKVSDKIQLIDRLIAVADTILIGGAMANTFLAARGLKLGDSLVEPDQELAVQQIEQVVRQKVGTAGLANFLRLPSDVVVLNHQGVKRDVAVTDIAPDERALDIGPRTSQQFATVIAGARTIIWNGPLGYTEDDRFAAGSLALARAIGDNTSAQSIVGGGDTADFVINHLQTEAFSHISTGGGASMALMAGQSLPGVESLLDVRGLK